MTMQAEKPYEIIRGGTKIVLPSGVSVAHPFYGPGNTKALREGIRSDGLQEPNGSVSAEFLATAYAHEEPEFENAREIMRHRYFRVFEGHNYDGNSQNLFVVSPDIIEFDEEARLLMPDARKLEKRLKDGDTRVRVVPFNKLYDGVSKLSRPEEVERIMPYLEAVYGEEGAEHLVSGVALKTRNKLIRTWLPSMPSAGEQKLRIATLNEGLDGGRLNVGGCGDGLLEYGHAFGVFPSA